MMSNPNYDRGTSFVDHEYHRFPSRRYDNRKRFTSFCESDIALFFTYFTYAYITVVTKVAPPIFDEFEMNLMGHLIDSGNLTILAPIGQGNCRV